MKILKMTILIVCGFLAVGCTSAPNAADKLDIGARQPAAQNEVPTLDCKLPDSVVSFKTFPPEWYAAADITQDDGARFRNQYLKKMGGSGGVQLRNIRQLREASYSHNDLGVTCVVTILSREISTGGSATAKFVCGNQQFNVTCQHHPSVYEN